MFILQKKSLLICLVVLFMQFTGAGIASELFPRSPDKGDKCPVCGMFVIKYPQWTAEILFKDGQTFFFDGAKDLFHFYLDLKKYAPAQQHEDISSIYVTEYYDTKMIEAQDAWYVLGSDVYGPMGHELIPFATEADGKQFMADHKGQKLVRFDEITEAMMKDL